MKPTGITRRVDDVGRVVIPRELLYTLGINTKDKMEMYVEGVYIVLKKYTASCHFCGSLVVEHELHGKLICNICVVDLLSQCDFY